MKKKTINYYDDNYNQVMQITKCPKCEVWFRIPNWYKIQCPVCDYTLKDERG